MTGKSRTAVEVRRLAELAGAQHGVVSRDRTVISHRSAGALLKLQNEGPAVIDVIAPPSRGRQIDGIRFHRVRAPRRDEVGTVDGIPCTSPARTLVDLAGVIGDRTLRSAFERTAQRRMLDIPAIEASIVPGAVAFARCGRWWMNGAPPPL